MRKGLEAWRTPGAMPSSRHDAVSIPLRRASEMMGADREQQDDRDGNADQPEQDGAHDFRLLRRPLGGDNGSRPERFR